MIEITEIGENLSIYKENKVVLWGGANHFLYNTIDKFNLLNIDIVAICSLNIKFHGETINNIPIISPEQLKNKIKKDDNIIVQMIPQPNEHEIVSNLKDLGVKKYISSTKLYVALNYLRNDNDIDFSTQYEGSSDGKQIRLTKIDEELSIYKNNKVIIWGSTQNKDMLRLLQYHNIEVYAYCTEESNINQIDIGINLITPKQLKELVDKNDDIVIQIGLPEQDDILKQIKELGIKQWVYYHEAWQVLRFFKRYKIGESNPEFLNSYLYVDDNSLKNLNKLKENVLSYCNTTALIVCTIMKTGDVTLNKTFQKNDIPYTNTTHSIIAVDKAFLNNSNLKKIKIVTGIREPISRYISEIYQKIGTIGVSNEKFFNAVLNVYPYEKESVLRKGGDFQYIFDNHEKSLSDVIINTNIENFVNKFCEKIVDIKKVPFNKEKGYSIIKEGNIEVFVYQLEKLNSIVPELSKFVGAKFDKLENGNVAADKWYADSYKQALEELKISQEFFDKCFNESYVEHFYSEDDINKFKERWLPHIRK